MTTAYRFELHDLGEWHRTRWYRTLGAARRAMERRTGTFAALGTQAGDIRLSGGWACGGRAGRSLFLQVRHPEPIPGATGREAWRMAWRYTRSRRAILPPGSAGLVRVAGLAWMAMEARL